MAKHHGEGAGPHDLPPLTPQPVLSYYFAPGDEARPQFLAALAWLRSQGAPEPQPVEFQALTPGLPGTPATTAQLVWRGQVGGQAVEVESDAGLVLWNPSIVLTHLQIAFQFGDPRRYVPYTPPAAPAPPPPQPGALEIIGGEYEGLPGKFACGRDDKLPLGAMHTALDGRRYIKRGKRGPFGWSAYWEVQG